MINRTSKALAIVTALNLVFSPLIATASTLDDYRTQAYDRASCPAYEGETQKECRERLRKKGENQNADWRPTVDESEIYTPSLDEPVYSRDGNQSDDSYNGEPGWSKMGQEERGECGPGENQRHCKPGENKNYDNDAKYQGECGAGVSQKECDTDLEEKGANKNYENDARFYGECGMGESLEACERRLGGNKNYKNDARYYGSCPARPDETQEECKERLAGKGKNENYELNMDDFNGNGSDPYAGIPGGNGSFGGNGGNGGSGDIYGGIPKDRNSSNKDWQQNNGDYGGNGAWGDFQGYGGDKGDWDALKNKQQEFNDAVNENVNKDGLYKDKEKGNALLTLIFCSLQIPFEGVGTVFGDKTCRRAVKDLCSFSVRRMSISGPAQCVGFAPWNM